MSTSVVDVLDEQHRRVAQLFQRVSSPDEDRPAVLHDLLREVAAHVASERSAVAPVVRRRHMGNGLSEELAADYERMERLLVLIERRKFNSPDIPQLVNELKDAVDDHAARSERELFPELSSRLSQTEAEELGAKVDREEDMIGTHPHPHLLSLGPLADRLTGVAARFDRLRDRTVNNRHPEGH